MSSSDLETLLIKLDGVNHRLLDIISNRADIIRKIEREKLKIGLPSFNPVHEHVMMKNVMSRNRGPLNDATIRDLFTQISIATLNLHQEKQKNRDRETPLKEKNIVLIGFMGVGKTTVGKLLANKLNRDFIDIDQEIEREFEMPTTKIFKSLGEAKFRETEKNMIDHFCTQFSSKVISLGGGAFMQEEVRNICLSTSIVFFLDLSFDHWKERLKWIVGSRPILQNKSLHEIETLFNQRQSAYMYHHSKINTDNLNPEDTAEKIIEALEVGWEIYG